MSTARMRLITAHGVEAIEIADEQQRSVVGRHSNAVGRFLATGDTDVLAPFVGVVIADRELLTDPHQLESWAAHGELEFEDLYDVTGW